jgi:hypothetical protein
VESSQNGHTPNFSSVFWGRANSKPAVQLGKVRGHPEEANSWRYIARRRVGTPIGHQATQAKVFCRTGIYRGVPEEHQP